MHRISQKLVEKVLKCTAQIYKESLAHLYPNTFESIDINQVSELEMKFILLSVGISHKNELITKEYLRRICLLPTKKLQLIVDMHIKNRVKRAPRTIEAITTELLERALYGDQTRNKDHSDEKPKSKANRRPNFKKTRRSGKQRKLRKS